MKNLLLILTGVVMMFTLSACGIPLQPGPSLPDIQGMTDEEIWKTVDEAAGNEWGNYPRLKGFENCEKPASAYDLITSGEAQWNVVPMWEANYQCMKDLPLYTQAILYSLSFPIPYPMPSCVKWEAVIDCKPYKAEVWTVNGGNNFWKGHEAAHLKGYADKTYGTFKTKDKK